MTFILCPNCDGSGELNPVDRCWYCEGSGMMQHMEIDLEEQDDASMYGYDGDGS